MFCVRSPSSSYSVTLFVFSLFLLFLSPHQLRVFDSSKPELWKMAHILVILPHLSQHAATHTHTRTQPTELSPPYLSSFLHLRLLFLLISHLSTSCLPFITPPYCSFILVRLSIWLSHFSSSVRTGDKNTGMKVDLTEAREQLNTVCSDMSRQTDISLKGC